MNDTRDDSSRPDIDPSVMTQYRMIADETAPAKLDGIVMQQAKAAATTPGRQFEFGRWMRPAAFAAMALLSLALLLEYNEVGLPDAGLSDISRPAVPGDPAVAPAARMPDDAARNRSAAETASALRREKAAPALTSKTAAEPQAADEEFADPAEASAPVDAAMTIIEGQHEPARIGSELGSPAAISRQVEPAVRALSQSREQRLEGNAVAPERCTDAQKVRAADWWQCIEALRNAGMSGLAATELEALRAKYPAFVVPE